MANSMEFFMMYLVFEGNNRTQTYIDNCYTYCHTCYKIITNGKSNEKSFFENPAPHNAGFQLERSSCIKYFATYPLVKVLRTNWLKKDWSK